MAWRKTSEIFRGGKKFLSDAIADGTAAWAIDDETLRDLQLSGVEFVGVWTSDTDDKYLTTLDAFLDRKKAQILNYETRGGALQRYLPLSCFSVITGSTRVK